MVEHIGIRGVGVYLPNEILSGEDVEKKHNLKPGFMNQMQFVRKHQEGALHPSDMALRASQDALNAAGVEGRGLDLVVFGNTGLMDYNMWSPAARIQYELEADHAYGFDLLNGCNAVGVAMDVFRNRALLNSETTLGLVCTAERYSAILERVGSNFHWGDAGAAVVLEKGGPGLRLKTFVSRTDGKFHDWVKLRTGGTRELTGQLRDVASRHSTRELMSFFEIRYNEVYQEVAHEALRRANRSIADVRYVITHNDPPDKMAKVSDAIGASPEQRVGTYDRVGHVGGADVLFSLKKVLEEKDLDSGDLVLMTNCGYNMSWSALLLEKP